MSITATGASADIRAPIRTRWLGLVVVFVLLLIAAGCYRYWFAWQANRFDESYSNREVRRVGRFYGNVNNQRFDAAYESATPGFQRRVGREDFEERARTYLAFHRKPDMRYAARNFSGPRDDKYRTRQIVKETYTLKDDEGNQLDVSITVVAEDSIFYMRPPAARVDDFSVKQVSAAAESQ